MPSGRSVSPWLLTWWSPATSQATWGGRQQHGLGTDLPSMNLHGVSLVHVVGRPPEMSAPSSQNL